jgi:molecular chaperone GrpE
MTKKKTDDQSKELTESLARVQADYANYRRRVQQEQEALKQRAAQELIEDLLVVLDNLELALKQSSNENEGLRQGVELVLSQLLSTLEAHGASRVQTEKFDPAVHEAIMATPSKEPKGTIIEVLQQGYSLAGKVLRTAKVKVSTGQEENQ